MDLTNLGLEDGSSITGENVEGSIGNVAAEGRGQLLVGSEGSNAEGLRILVKISALNPLPRTHIFINKINFINFN